MEEERYTQFRESVAEQPHEGEEIPGNLGRGRPTERLQFVTPVLRNVQDRIYHEDGSLSPRELNARRNPSRPRPGNHANEKGPSGNRMDYERPRRQGSSYRNRASAHRSAGYFQETPYMERIPEFFFNEPRQYFPTLSDEWEAFWLKFQLMARRYSWSEEKQREQLLFCLKEEALNFAATLGPQIRDDPMTLHQRRL